MTSFFRREIPLGVLAAALALGLTGCPTSGKSQKVTNFSGPIVNGRNSGSAVIRSLSQHHTSAFLEPCEPRGRARHRRPAEIELLQFRELADAVRQRRERVGPQVEI